MTQRHCQRSWMRLLRFVATLLLLLLLLVHTTVAATAETARLPYPDDDDDHRGPNAKALADQYMSQQDYERAAAEYWRAVLFHTQTPQALQYNVQDAFGLFLQCYQLQGKPVAEGLAFVALESFRRNQAHMGQQFLSQALEADPTNEAALAVQRDYGGTEGAQKDTKTTGGFKASKTKPTTSASADVNDDKDDELSGQSPEQLYALASQHFADKEYEACADIFERSCQLSQGQLGPSCANAVYCRSMILDWGFNGTQFELDMQRIVDLTQHETQLYRFRTTDADVKDENALSKEALLSNAFAWQRATSVHPHMMLGYPLPPEWLVLKRFVAESVAYMDELMARVSRNAPDDPTIPPLPNDLPFDINPQEWLDEVTSTPDYKIRVGFVGSGFNSKAVLYLSHDMFRFFDTTKFEIHVFSFNPPDSRLFLTHGMRGVDWRKRVQSNVHKFHDLRHMVEDHMAAARYIRKQRIHILIEWDGYARQGERAQGLFGLRPAPLQMLHQEYLGTSGALYTDYVFTDATTSPKEETAHLFTEQLIYLPHHFFSKGHALQAEVHPPTLEYTPRAKGQKGYQLGTGTPQQNRCLSSSGNNDDDDDVSFVFCNWNKMLKNNPETVRSWIRILREVPGSILCLLENPTTSVEYLRKFVHEAAGTTTTQSSSSSDNPYETFRAGDGDDLNRRIFFLPWERNPFDHQRRNQDFCNVMLDSWPYNGHTVAQDALYAGVPIVTRSDGWDMSSRVTTSANHVLGLSQELNAEQGPRQYEDMAIALGTNQTLYRDVRTRLVQTALQRNPMHPYWDVPRYVKNFEHGLEAAWDRFLQGQAPEHIVVQERASARRGTFDEEIAAHPPMGPRPVLEEEENV